MAFAIDPQSVDLIAAMDRAWPERCIGPHETLEAAHRYAGRRDLINELKTHLKLSTERPGEIPHVHAKRPGERA